MTPARQLLPGLLPNLRDLGGLPVVGQPSGAATACGPVPGEVLRFRRLLRSAALADLPPGTCAALAATVGAASYLDLRTDPEVERDGGPAGLLSRGWQWHRLPLRDKEPGEPPDSPDLVRAAISVYVAAARHAVDLLASGRPLVIGCAAGKDRTGMVISVLLYWLGVPRPEIIADYLLTNAVLRSGRHLLPGWQDGRRQVTEVRGEVCAALLDAVTELGPAAVPDRIAVVRPSMLMSGGAGADPAATAGLPG